MANGTGNPGIQTAWEDGDLVFYGAGGTVEALRISADGTVSLNGVVFPADVGDAGDILTSDGTALSFAPPAP